MHFSLHGGSIPPISTIQTKSRPLGGFLFCIPKVRVTSDELLVTLIATALSAACRLGQASP
jgi:hypothetical protein